MAEVSLARETRPSSLNALGASRRGGILAMNGSGKTVVMSPSTNKAKNEAMQFLSDRFSVSGASGNPSVDSYIRENNGSYEVKVWNTTGQTWRSGKQYGSIVPVNNNTDRTLSIKKQRGKWTGTLTERRYYGQPPITITLF